MIDVRYLEQQRSGQATQHLFRLLGHAVSQPIHKNPKTELKSSVEIKRSAHVAIRGLDVNDRRAVNSLIHRLRISPVSVMARIDPILDLGDAGSMYLLPVEDLELVVRRFRGGPLDPAHILVEDVFDRSRLTQISIKGDPPA